VVTSHHDDILTYVGPHEVGQPDLSDVVVGLVGRGKRDQDARELEIIHVRTGVAIRLNGLSNLNKYKADGPRVVD
jgi:hypothetical protein